MSGQSSSAAGSDRVGYAVIIKTIVVSIMVLIAGYVLVFKGRATVAAHDEGRTLVMYWEKWTGNEASQMQEIVQWFNDTVGKDKGIYVQYLSMSNINQKTLVATAAGVPPDVAGLWDTQVAQFAAIDALEPLDALAAEHGITEGYYKPVYWKTCQYKGKLYALISTPAAVGLHYNKQSFIERAEALRKAGLDPERLPRTLEELDRYARAMDVLEPKSNGGTSIKSAGYLPMEPGWFLHHTGRWFGATIFDEKTDKLYLNDEKMVQAYQWIRSYSERLGKDSMSEFRSGFGQFNSTQNAFLTGTVAMEQQGPWMANYIEDLAPKMNRWGVPEEKLAREKKFAEVREGMPLAEVTGLLGRPLSIEKANADGGALMICSWDGGIKTLQVTFADGKVTAKEAKLLPAVQRRTMTQWGVEAFPSAVPGLEDVTYAGFDILAIPKGSKHKKEAMEFIAFVNRQEVMEKLCSLHCKNSPLAKVSEAFIKNHPNPYIEVFERLSASPNAYGIPPIPVWPEVSAELNVANDRVYLLQATPKEALDAAQARAQAIYDRFLLLQKLRGVDVAAAEATADHEQSGVSR